MIHSPGGTPRELHDVVVTVDQAGDNRASVQVKVRARGVPGNTACGANTGDAIAANHDRSHDGIARIHRRDRPVVKHKFIAFPHF